MAAGSRDFERPFRAFLAFDVFEIERICPDLAYLRLRAGQNLSAAKMVGELKSARSLQ